MAAPTQYYCDPAIAADSGTGTIGDPFGDLQYTLNTITRDATNGDQINIKAGTDEILVAAIDLTTYGSPAAGSPLILRGYTAAAGDGGMGGISGGGSVSIYAQTKHYIHFVDLHLHNCGANPVINSSNSLGIMAIGCEVDNSSSYGLLFGAESHAIGCYIHNIGLYGIRVSTGGHALFNFLLDGTNKFTRAISTATAAGAVVAFNIVSLGTSSGYGIYSEARQSLFMNNCVYADAGTGIGIWQGTLRSNAFTNNLVEGFSGVGGRGFLISTDLTLYGSNKVYNCTTAFTITGDILIDLGGNDTLGASPFVSPATADFSLTEAAQALLRSAGWPSSYLGAHANTDPHITIGALQYGPVPESGGGRRPRARYHGV